MILTGLSAATGHNRDRRFRAGYEAAIGDLALAFGLVVERRRVEEREPESAQGDRRG